MLCGLTVWRGSLTVAAGWPWWEGNLFLSLSVWTSGGFLCVPCLKEGNRRYSFWRESRRWEAPGLTLRCIISNAQKWCLTDDLKVFKLFRLMVKYEVCFFEEGGHCPYTGMVLITQKDSLCFGLNESTCATFKLETFTCTLTSHLWNKELGGQTHSTFVCCKKNKTKKQTVLRLEVSWMLHLKCVTRIKQMANKMCSIKNNNNMETENVMWPCNQKSAKKGDQWLERRAL